MIILLNLLSYCVLKVPLDIDSFLVRHQNSIDNVMDKYRSLRHQCKGWLELNFLTLFFFFHLLKKTENNVTACDNSENKVRKIGIGYNIGFK